MSVELHAQQSVDLSDLYVFACFSLAFWEGE